MLLGCTEGTHLRTVTRLLRPENGLMEEKYHKAFGKLYKTIKYLFLSIGARMKVPPIFYDTYTTK